MTSTLKFSRGTQNGPKRWAALVSDNILLKWSQNVALLVLVPFKNSPYLKCPESYFKNDLVYLDPVNYMLFYINVAV